MQSQGPSSQVTCRTRLLVRAFRRTTILRGWVFCAGLHKCLFRWNSLPLHHAASTGSCLCAPERRWAADTSLGMVGPGPLITHPNLCCTFLLAHGIVSRHGKDSPPHPHAGDVSRCYLDTQGAVDQRHFEGYTEDGWCMGPDFFFASCCILSTPHFECDLQSFPKYSQPLPQWQ